MQDLLRFLQHAPGLHRVLNIVLQPQSIAALPDSVLLLICRSHRYGSLAGALNLGTGGLQQHVFWKLG